MPCALVTGGAGYIGSHTCKALRETGWDVVAYDNLSRGWRNAVKYGPLVEGDIADASTMAATFRRYRPDVVVHFAAYAYVGESVEDPGAYYRNNVAGTLTLLEQMRIAQVDRLIFSSSCATYGLPVSPVIDENHPQSPINPYGRTKLMCEQMIADFCNAYELSAVLLRYFNAAGSDPDGQLGERHEPETHAIPLAIRSALFARETFNVMGSDFATPDGSAVRDYIHVSDLARAHVLATAFLEQGGGCHAFNLGTGKGTSVLELLEAIERVVGKRPEYRLAARRPGDPGMLVASFDKAARQLGWEPRLSSIDRIIGDAARWMSKDLPNPPNP